MDGMDGRLCSNGSMAGPPANWSGQLTCTILQSKWTSVHRPAHVSAPAVPKHTCCLVSCSTARAAQLAPKLPARRPSIAVRVFYNTTLSCNERPSSSPSRALLQLSATWAGQEQQRTNWVMPAHTCRNMSTSGRHPGFGRRPRSAWNCSSAWNAVCSNAEQPGCDGLLDCISPGSEMQAESEQCLRCRAGLTWVTTPPATTLTSHAPGCTDAKTAGPMPCLSRSNCAPGGTHSQRAGQPCSVLSDKAHQRCKAETAKSPPSVRAPLA